MDEPMPVAKQAQCDCVSNWVHGADANLPFEDYGVSLGFALDDVEYTDGFV